MDDLPSPARYPAYTRGRLRRLLDELRGLVYPEREPLDELLIAGPVQRVSYAEAQELAFRPATLGERLGPPWSTYWLTLRAAVPPGWAGCRVDLRFVTGTEATLWRDGTPAQGLVSGQAERTTARLLDPAQGGERLELAIELACNPMFGAVGMTDRPATLETAELVRFDPDAWRLLHDFRVLVELEAEHENGLDPAWAGELLRELNRFCNLLSAGSPAGASVLGPLLRRTNASRSHRISAIGHAHLDTAWLWPLAESRRKLQRTVSSQLELMERYPEHRFACSSAQHYAWLKESDPALFEAVLDRIRGGQWVAVGGSWVEPDCNLPSGESLVRQLLYGQRFFERELGVRARELWIPDTFGYNSQLPQIARGAGTEWMLTQKLSWNRFTHLPHHTFCWQGLDGSRIFTHFPPADTYNSGASIGELRGSARAYRDHARSGRSLLVFGHGDGGGGPTPEMLETLRRAGDLQGVPRTELSTSEEFFDALERDAGELPVHVGELYFEYHRGTYTTQAAIKRGNRRAEALLHDAEFLAVLASCEAGTEYPRAVLDELWRTLLLHQFHDILPGSSIQEVNVQARAELERITAEAEELGARLAAALAEPTAAASAPLNTIGAARAEVAQQPDGQLVFVRLPMYGVGRAADRAPEPVTAAQTPDGFVLGNGRLLAELGRDGSLRSLRLGDREALSAPGNRLELYEDRPLEWDAWDLDPFHLEMGSECPGADSARITTEHPLRVEITFERAIGERSTVAQVVRLDAGSDRLEFHTEVDWHERHRVLKVAFPLLVHAERASYETAFGHAERPTHSSTPADLARYEVPGHRWADLSEHGFGVALLNDCKYGMSAYGSTLRLTLLRAPTSPDPEADQGLHAFAYALLPHLGDWRSGGVVASARAFNQPLRWLPGDVPERSFFSVGGENLVLDTVKLAEDSDALVLRLYEAHGARGTARLHCALPVRAARRANLLEEPEDALELQPDGAVELAFRPYEIITVLVER